MEKHFVGGAVRDMIMGLEPKDRDYVVVGATEDDMFSNGFQKVGADFPVFLHPETGEEYALARREKKTGTGYLGFTSEFGSDVTLEEDLGRRDLTVNSIAMDDSGNLIDPFGGQTDIQRKILRHTSNAFQEDPVRVLRVARFRARFGKDWTVAPETKILIHSMAKKGTLNELTSERVWKELSRALMEPFPRLFFDTLLECDALHVLFPEIYKLVTALESHRWHPEGTAYEHTLLVLTQAAQFNFDLDTRFAALVHDIGKGLTKFEHLPKHYGHDVNGVPVVETFSNRLSVPAVTRDRAMKATRFHMAGHSLDKLSSKGWIKMFDGLNIKNDPSIIKLLYEVFCCDARGRLGSENDNIDHLKIIFKYADAYNSVKFTSVFPNGETNVEKIKNGMHRARTVAVDAKKKEWSNNV